MLKLATTLDESIKKRRIFLRVAFKTFDINIPVNTHSLSNRIMTPEDQNDEEEAQYIRVVGIWEQS